MSKESHITCQGRETKSRKEVSSYVNINDHDSKWNSLFSNQTPICGERREKDTED